MLAVDLVCSTVITMRVYESKKWRVPTAADTKINEEPLSEQFIGMTSLRHNPRFRFCAKWYIANLIFLIYHKLYYILFISQNLLYWNYYIVCRKEILPNYLSNSWLYRNCHVTYFLIYAKLYHLNCLAYKEVILIKG